MKKKIVKRRIKIGWILVLSSILFIMSCDDHLPNDSDYYYFNGEFGKIIEGSVRDILKEYADKMMQQLPIDMDTNRPDVEEVYKQAEGLKVACDKAKTMLDFYYAAYLGMNETAKITEEQKDEGSEQAGD